MKIGKNKVVEVLYELTVDGKIVDSATKDNPLDYIHGTHMLIPKFESEIEGLSEGDFFSFTVSPDEGYGQYDPTKRIVLSKDAFKIDGVIREDLLVEGYVIPMLNRNGEVEQGTIIEVQEDRVVMDFNHRMAGKELLFTGSILSVRDATEKELTEGLHGEYLPKEGHCCHGGGHHGKGGCCHGGHGHHGDGEGCCHGEGEGHHGDGDCCCHGEGEGHHGDGDCCCHGEGESHHGDGDCCCHKN